VQVLIEGCFGTASDPLAITGDLSDPARGFLVYPNPAKDRILVDLHEFLTEPVELKIMDQKGRSMLLQKVTGGEVTEIGISEHAAGMYIIFAAQGDKLLKARYIKGQ
jgi:hypothetical protein